MPPSPDPYEALGAYLTATEAEALAALLQAGQHVALAVNAVGQPRREEVAALLAHAGISHADPARAVAVLHAIVGAKSIHHDLVPVWTMPGEQADLGHLTSEFHRLVSAARQSVTCATYNFQPTSRMWTVLKEASETPGVVVTVYVDADAADTEMVKAQLPRAVVYKSGTLPNGQRLVSHAKFVIIDHELLLLTSANFSWSAENRNVEFGLLVQDSALASSVEATMTGQHGLLYETVGQARQDSTQQKEAWL